MRQFIGIILFTCMILIACQKGNKSKGIKTHSDYLVVNTFMPNTFNKSFDFVSEDFQIFYNKFITDSIFQIKHIKFPLNGGYSDYEKDEQWTKKNWKSIRFDIQNVINQNSDSISIKQNSTSFFFGLYCIDCGFSFIMEFNKLNTDWYLVYRQENNF